METDWEFEVGGDAPVIEAQWAGFVDLHSSPERAAQLSEAAQLPALAEALVKLNADPSPVWTSKCDVWPHLAPDEFLLDELDAPSGCICGMGCYIDLLPGNHLRWTAPDKIAEDCKQACSLLREVPLRCCRVDLVIRRALIRPELMSLGITAYITSCGGSDAEATIALQAALKVFAGVLSGHSTIK